MQVIQRGETYFVRRGDTMNAGFPDQSRTAIEVREIGNPSGNDIVRLLYIHTRAIHHTHFPERFSFRRPLSAWT